MRHCISLLAACSGLALTTTILVPSQTATATENKAAVTQIAAVGLETQNLPSNQTKVVCSRNRPLSFASEGTKVASGIGLKSTDWSSNVIRLFCRDVRINTIVVRDYCALIRQ
jgi:hypothetical protein